MRNDLHRRGSNPQAGTEKVGLGRQRACGRNRRAHPQVLTFGGGDSEQSVPKGSLALSGGIHVGGHVSSDRRRLGLDQASVVLARVQR